MTAGDLSNTIATLIVNGFRIDRVDRFAGDNSIIHASKQDKLGATIRYSILFSDDAAKTAIIDALIRSSDKMQALPILVNDFFEDGDVKTYSKKQFYDFFGGLVNTGLILIPDLPNLLNELGHNRLPVGLSGEPGELLELYASECFMYLMESPTRRYGSERRFEKIADGIVLAKGKFILLFDAKAYADGFGFTSVTINSLSFYVEDMTQRYSAYFGPIFTVVVISGHFTDSINSLQDRADELYRRCNCRIACIAARELGDIVQLLWEYPEKKGSIDWKSVFSNVMVQKKLVETELNRISKDKLH